MKINLKYLFLILLLASAKLPAQIVSGYTKSVYRGLNPHQCNCRVGENLVQIRLILIGRYSIYKS